MTTTVHRHSRGLILTLVVISLKSVLVYGTSNATKICGAYCDFNNNQQQGWHCHSPPLIYCCGSIKFKYCCSQANLSSYYLSYNHTCQTSETWWYFEPWIVTGVLVSVVILAICLCWRYIGCSCCSSSPFSRHTTANDRGSDEIDIEHFSNDFDPTSLFAFEPPAYDTLPKDPPLYSEVFGGPSSAVGQDNLAYTAHEGQTDDGAMALPYTTSSPRQSPPPYGQANIAIIDNIYGTLDRNTSSAPLIISPSQAATAVGRNCAF